MADKFDLPSKSNLLRLNKTQGGSKNATKIEKEMLDHIKDMIKDVDEEGKAAAVVITPYIGTPSAGYFTVEIEMRMVWPKRKVPGVAPKDKKILVTTGIKIEFQVIDGDRVKVIVAYNKKFFSQFLVEPKTGKPIDSGLAETAAVIEDSFAQQVNKHWPEKERKDKYREPTGEHIHPMSDIQDNSSLFAKALTSETNNFVEELKAKAKDKDKIKSGVKKQERITFVNGDPSTGYFKVVSEIIMETTGLKKEADAIKVDIITDVWFRDNRINARSLDFSIEYDINKNLKKTDLNKYGKDMNKEYEKQRDLSLKMTIRTLQQRYLNLHY